MSLVNITNFDEALVLLGLYEREVMKTGILNYPAQWPKPPSQRPVKPESKPIEEKVEKPSSVESPQPVSPTPALPSTSNVTNTDNSTIIINEAPPVPSSPPVTIQPVPEINYEAKRNALLTEQEKERRLFYLFVEELERTGDLRKLPAVLHSPSRS